MNDANQSNNNNVTVDTNANVDMNGVNPSGNVEGAGVPVSSSSDVTNNVSNVNNAVGVNENLVPNNNVNSINANVNVGNNSTTVNNETTSNVSEGDKELSNGSDVEVLQEGPDTNSYSNDKMKEVEINYTPPSKFKVFLLVTFFVVLIAFVIFLPEINSFVETYKAKKESPTPTTITTGRLECDLARTTSNLDISYEKVFHFTDSKLESLSDTTITKGDVDLDEATLDEENNKCLTLKDYTQQLRGIIVTCDYKQGILDMTQTFTFADVDKDLLDTAYSEAGGLTVEFENGENIDLIEKSMKAAGYTCERKTN